MANVITDLGVVLTVLITPFMSYTEFKVMTTHFGLVLILIGMAITPFHRTPLDVPVACFLGAAVIATLWSRNGRSALLPRPRRGDGLITLAGYAMTALAIARMTPEARNWLLVASVGVATIISMIAIGQSQSYAWARKLGAAKSNTDGVWGTQGNPAVLGGYLVLMLPIALWITQHTLWNVVPIVIAAALFTTGCRAAVLGLLAIIGWTAWMMPLGLIQIGLGITLGIVFSQRLFERTGIRSVAFDRAYLWGYIASQIIRRPLFGYGPNMLIVDTPDQRPEIHDSAHNEVLNIAHQVGLVGLAAYVWIWSTTLLGIRSPAVEAGLGAYAVWLMFTWNALGPAGMCWACLGFIA